MRKLLVVLALGGCASMAGSPVPQAARLSAETLTVTAAGPSPQLFRKKAVYCPGAPTLMVLPLCPLDHTMVQPLQLPGGRAPRVRSLMGRSAIKPPSALRKTAMSHLKY